ncbi:ArsA family ATPase [Halomonas heilongjiangensis]|uniref:arsenite-transporting ATPase n=1 Tax=Halomonas heilongjiangensis TaxID=1387883 RepID=A0A2N7TNR2_9GAMM|nr:ArsA family ATPase [Halomonas heilongjiangensis]PMR69820.1 arsenic-transporting ATPase [Halomonas heilongjiangensis]PXX92117.1 arsenic-transporting ATPase [Halomonas heilongjiangensis]
MKELLDKRLLWVGGKGGVGKTTVAAALAVLAARRGKRVLVVSTDPAHSLGDVFDRELGDTPRRLLPGLDAMEIDPDAEVDAHLARVTEQMRRYAAPEMMAELERQMRLTRQSPGTQEAALLERLSRLVTAADVDHDLIIFDTAPTGHTLRLLTLPEAMAAWTDGLLAHNRKSEELGRVLSHLTPKRGRDVATPFDDPEQDPLADLDERTRDVARTLIERRRLFHRARRCIEDAEETSFLFVLTPERLPILETARAVEALEAVHVPVAGTLVNRVIPEDADGDFLRARRAQEATYLARIDAELGHLPRPRLPWLPTDVQGIEILEGLADRLAAEGF